MNPFEKSKWIWPVAEAQPDEYAEFFETVDFYGRSAELFISSDSNPSGESWLSVLLIVSSDL